jgi:hypothetical protein
MLTSFRSYSHPSPPGQCLVIGDCSSIIRCSVLHGLDILIDASRTTLVDWMLQQGCYKVTSPDMFISEITIFRIVYE